MSHSTSEVVPDMYNPEWMAQQIAKPGKRLVLLVTAGLLAVTIVGAVWLGRKG
jgi:hypothetical protein